jgi:hypothetical protein
MTRSRRQMRSLRQACPWRSRYTVEVLAPREGASCYSLIQDRETRHIWFSKKVELGPIVINALLVAVSEEQLRSNLRGDLRTVLHQLEGQSGVCLVSGGGPGCVAAVGAPLGRSRA